MVTVLYAEWEMACCGSPFEIGDKIEWTVSKVDKVHMGWIDKDPVIKKLGYYFTTDYQYQSHTTYSPEFLILSGIVRKITLICITHTPSQNNPLFLVPVSGFTWDVKTSKYRTNVYIRTRLRANEFFDVDAYRVEIEDPTIRPCLPEDWGIENL